MIRKLIAWYRLRTARNLYKRKTYLDAYQAHTDIRIDHDPEAAIGGDWEVLGRLQFNFLKNEGLQPHSSFLDIGMGTLRGGRFFIDYLRKGNYTGFDISPRATKYAMSLVKKLGLQDKRPLLLLNKEKNLTFSFLDTTYDFILAQSVFTHLLEVHIEEAMRNLNKIMHKKSRFYFTILEGPIIEEIKNDKDIYYPFSFFKELASKYNLSLTDCSDRYEHPKGQKMLMLTLN